MRFFYGKLWADTKSWLSSLELLAIIDLFQAVTMINLEISSTSRHKNLTILFCIWSIYWSRDDRLICHWWMSNWAEEENVICRHNQLAMGGSQLPLWHPQSCCPRLASHWLSQRSGDTSLTWHWSDWVDLSPALTFGVQLPHLSSPHFCWHMAPIRYSLHQPNHFLYASAPHQPCLSHSI